MRETMRKKCSNTEFLWSLFSRIWTKYGDLRSKSPYSVQIRENTDQNNSIFDHFYTVKFFCIIYLYCCNQKILRPAWARYILTTQCIFMYLFSLNSILQYWRIGLRKKKGSEKFFLNFMWRNCHDISRCKMFVIVVDILCLPIDVSSPFIFENQEDSIPSICERRTFFL